MSNKAEFIDELRTCLFEHRPAENLLTILKKIPTDKLQFNLQKLLVGENKQILDKLNIKGKTRAKTRNKKLI